MRIADLLNDKLSKLGQKTGKASAFMALDTGGQCTIGGIGKMFDEFRKSGRVKNYSGYGETLKKYGEDGFKDCSVRYIKLDETYFNMPYSCVNSNIYFINQLKISSKYYLLK